MNRRWRGMTSTAFAAAALAMLAGCGFTPLYTEAGVASGMTHVQVVAPEGRVGFLLGEDLNDDLGRTKGEAPAYRLDMQLGQVRQAHGLESNNTAQRYELDLTVTYTLTDLSTGKVAHTGVVTSFVSYDSANQPYAGIAAREDTENRVAQDAALKIQTQIAAWMSRQSGG
jgi:LPS-assembly lipoprotein